MYNIISMYKFLCIIYLTLLANYVSLQINKQNLYKARYVLSIHIKFDIHDIHMYLIKNFFPILNDNEETNNTILKLYFCNSS